MFPKSFTLPDEAVKLQLSGGESLEGASCEMVRFCLSLPSPSVSNDLHVNIDTPPRFLLTLRFSNIHTRKHTHTYTRNTHKDTIAHAHSHVYAHVYVYVSVYENVSVLETATRSEKKNMKPLRKSTSICIFHSARQYSCKRWNWRRT